ncbi:class I SAM-dependent methyltransferase [Candidatus Thiosymbion oneisti]|uniref:class I SAM-dependent methyltransferase n=1 Tax=Candidatus Thiosymbion oneisti TaxID=589554 RepID=UPI00105DFA41|nr:class I SAM-dependent methyltransferase [Candidatus Thiosymbion oneisti]
MKYLFDWLCDPSVEGVDVDGTDRLSVHRCILKRKRMLREVFQTFHHDFRTLDERFLSGEGSRIEVGAGAAPIRDSFPDVLATDIMENPQLDRVLDAQAMKLPDSSVRCVYAQNSFHHFSDPERFFAELQRVLIPGGGAILIEPYYGLLASLLFPRMFSTEGFDKNASSWQVSTTSSMHGANQALSYLVFVRDREFFETRYPGLKIAYQQTCNNYLKYLLSGGLNFRQLLPDWMTQFVGLLSLLLSPFNRWLALHHLIVIKKIST